jgi:hypothetical protein
MDQMGRDMTVSFEAFNSVMESIFSPSGPPAPARQTMSTTGSAARLNELMGLSLLGWQLRREREEKTYLTPETIQLAEAEVRAWCPVTPIPLPLVRLVLRLWHE